MIIMSHNGLGDDDDGFNAMTADESLVSGMPSGSNAAAGIIASGAPTIQTGPSPTLTSMPTATVPAAGSTTTTSFNTVAQAQALTVAAQQAANQAAQRNLLIAAGLVGALGIGVVLALRKPAPVSAPKAAFGRRRRR